MSPSTPHAMATRLGITFDGLQDWETGQLWAFTDRDPRSPTYQITFYTLPGATFAEVARRLDEKRTAEMEVV